MRFLSGGRMFNGRNRTYSSVLLASMLAFVSTLLAAIVLALTSAQAFADTALPEPYQIVQQTTEQVLAIIRDGKGYYDKDPARFNQQVETVMDKVVDFESFARGVMGPYAGAQRYQALTTEKEKNDFRARIQRFSDTFKQGLIETYAKGLLKFDGQKIETLPPRKGDDVASGNVAVLQNIYGAADKPYVLQYSMRRNREGVWKLHNVIIEGINLGQTYRSQFAASADHYHGDLDLVIANWHVEPEVETRKTDTSKQAGVAKDDSANAGAGR